MPGGRPSLYTPELGARICEAIVDSDYGLEQVCSERGFPKPAAIYSWLFKHEEFAAMYARAREAQGHVQAERAARDALEAKDPQLGRLAYDARKWQASKLAPRTWGDSAQLRHADANGEKLPDNGSLVSELVSLLKPGAKDAGD